jgi:hypothetical protein
MEFIADAVEDRDHEGDNRAFAIPPSPVAQGEEYQERQDGIDGEVTGDCLQIGRDAVGLRQLLARGEDKDQPHPEQNGQPAARCSPAVARRWFRGQRGISDGN